MANYLRNEQAAEQLKTIAAKEQSDYFPLSCGFDQRKEAWNSLTTRFRSTVQIYPVWSTVPRPAFIVPLDELTDRHFDFTFALNVRAFFKLIKLVKPRLQKGSSVVAISSWGATRALPYYTLVGASKGALESLARHLAVELAPEGIRVNILTAGAVLTDVWKAMPNSEARIAETIRRTPAGRLVTPRRSLMASSSCVPMRPQALSATL